MIRARGGVRFVKITRSGREQRKETMWFTSWKIAKSTPTTAVHLSSGHAIFEDSVGRRASPITVQLAVTTTMETAWMRVIAIGAPMTTASDWLARSAPQIIAHKVSGRTMG